MNKHTDLQLLGRVAELHYKHELSHREIGELLDMSRVKITRLLDRARQEGIVEIRVHSSGDLFAELAEKVRSRWSLERVWVSPPARRRGEYSSSLALEGAKAINEVLDSRISSVSLCLSRASRDVADCLEPPLSRPDVRFIPVTGTPAGSSFEMSTLQLTLAFADAYQAQSLHLPVPYMATNELIGKELKKDPEVARVFRSARSADLLVSGIGGSEPHPYFNAVNDEQRKELISRGMVGDVCSRFFDNDGHHIETANEELLMGLTWNELMSIPRRLLIAGGINKVAAVKGAVRGRVMTHLVTDVTVAEQLVK